MWAAKKLRRGELWTAIDCLNGFMMSRVPRMIEWHTHATRDDSVDTWRNGRFLEVWAEPRAIAGLRRSFAHYDVQDIARGLLATMDLYRWLTRETAAAVGYPYSTEADERTTAWVRECLAEI